MDDDTLSDANLARATRTAMSVGGSALDVANPAGLSTADPMRHAGYRAAVRRASDRYQASKGRPPLPRFEDAWEEDR